MKPQDISNKRFGRLVAMHTTGRTTSGGRVWLCKCDCGGTTETTAGYLNIGKTRSCGCLQKEATSAFGQRRRKVGAAFRRLFQDYQSNAKKSESSFLLTEDQFRNLTQASCDYCGAPPAQQKKVSGETYLYNGVDRVNRLVGYESENCVPCCWICNQMKSTFGRVKFLSAVKKIYERQREIAR